jgi:UDP-galactopyranose mutase
MSLTICNSNPRVPVVILGAGITGLSAAYHVGSNYRLFEAQSHVGGVASSFHVGAGDHSSGWRFDHAIHVLYTRDAYAAALLKTLLGPDLLKHVRNAVIYSEGRFTKYPYQAHQYGLPAQIVEENLLGLLDRNHSETSNFEEWIVKTYGSGIAKNFMLPYNRKVWATDLREMSIDWIEGRVPRTEFRDVLRSVLNINTEEYGHNAEFWYPRRDGIQRLPNAFIEAGVRAECGCAVREIDTNRRALLVDGIGEVLYDEIISTLPIPRLVNLIDERDPQLREAAQSLRFNRVVTVNIGARSASTHSAHWVYVPDQSIPFQRFSVPSNFSTDCAPRDGVAITTETSVGPTGPINIERIVQQTLDALSQMGIVRSEDVECVVPRVIDPAYVVPTTKSVEIVNMLLSSIQERGIISCGRFGAWKYLNMDEAILDGKFAAETVMSSRVEV